jgi:hypothetical protein
MFQAFKTFFWETEIRGNREKNGSNPVHIHETRWQQHSLASILGPVS